MIKALFVCLSIISTNDLFRWFIQMIHMDIIRDISFFHPDSSFRWIIQMNLCSFVHLYIHLDKFSKQTTYIPLCWLNHNLSLLNYIKNIFVHILFFTYLFLKDFFFFTYHLKYNFFKKIWFWREIQFWDFCENTFSPEYLILLF